MQVHLANATAECSYVRVVPELCDLGPWRVSHPSFLDEDLHVQEIAGTLRIADVGPCADDVALIWVEPVTRSRLQAPFGSGVLFPLRVTTGVDAQAVSAPRAS